MKAKILFLACALALASMAGAQSLTNMNGTVGRSTLIVDGITASSNEIHRADLDVIVTTTIGLFSPSADYHVLATPIPPGHTWVPSQIGMAGIYISGMPHPWGTVCARSSTLGAGGVAVDAIEIPLGLDSWCDVVLQAVIANPGTSVAGIFVNGFTFVGTAAVVIR